MTPRQWTTSAIRRQFLDFFAGHGHTIVPSSPLVPANDPTLLFTNAGMVQFKDVFLGADKRPYSTAASSQKCVRAGGKHNDLDQVGYTARHHTFFEMLGNFSFGDYLKQDAIRYAWTLLTDVYGLESERLWVTVYHTDDEAWGIWRNTIGVPEERLVRIGDKPGGREFESDNFWAMGDTGPCGPCTEIFYDHGAEVAGGPPGSAGEDGDRFIEIWNLVFMQFDRGPDGELAPLPGPCVDTGMGLERIAAVLQGVHSNYQIDLFCDLIAAAAKITDCPDTDNQSLNVIADHIRACAFLVADGVLPSRDGRGYVLRRIIRRAVRHGYMLGCRTPFFHEMVGPLVESMGEAYPQLVERRNVLESTLADEEERFFGTLGTGMNILEDVMKESGDAIDGKTAFLLYDTYGFPLDLTQDIARERGLAVDTAGFEAEMEKQQERGRSASRFGSRGQVSAEVIRRLPETRFVGYQTLEEDAAEVAAIVVDGAEARTLEPGLPATVFLDSTPFYGESGGQVGDTGVLSGPGMEFRVEDTQKMGGSFHAHLGTLVEGRLSVGDRVRAAVDGDRREAIVRHHSATHLLHAALKMVLGDHVEQRGSLVAPDHLRFDFTHPKAVAAEEIREIERLVNAEIRRNEDAQIDIMGFDDALKTGAVALFGEKYGDEVRVLRFGTFSVELCGGTHVARVGDIGQFKIVEESSIASGIRRIVAVAGEAAVDWILGMEDRLREAAGSLKVAPEALSERIEQLLERQRNLEREVEDLQARLARSSGDELLDKATEVDGIRVLAECVQGVDAKALRSTVDRLKERLGTAVVVLGSADGGKVRLAAGVSADLATRIHAGNLVNFVAQQVGGKGGGRPDFAQAGGSEPDKLASALSSVSAWVKKCT